LRQGRRTGARDHDNDDNDDDDHDDHDASSTPGVAD
jgi:hypothetical protein